MVFDHFYIVFYEKAFSENGAKAIVIVMLFARFFTKKQKTKFLVKNTTSKSFKKLQKPIQL